MADQMTTHEPGTARSEAQNVMHDARQEASGVVSEAATQAQNVVGDARTALRTRARQGTDRAAGALSDLGSRFDALATGDSEGSGELRRYAADTGRRLQSLADRLGSRGFDGVVDDVQGFARRRPGLFLAIAATTGFAAGRLFRAGTASEPAAEGPGREVGNGHRSAAVPSAREVDPSDVVPAGPPDAIDMPATPAAEDPRGLR